VKIQRRLFQYLLDYRLSLLGLVGFALLTALSIIFQAQWISKLIHQAVFEQQSVGQLMPAFKILAGVLLLRGTMQFLYQFTANRLGSRIIRKIRTQGLQQILPALVKRDGSLSSGQMTTLFSDKLDALKGYYAQYFSQMLLAAVIPLTVLAVVFPLDWITGIVFLLTAPLIPVFMILIGSQSKKATEYRWGYLSRLADHFGDHIRGMEVLKQFNQAQNSLTEIEHVSRRYASLTMDILKITFLSALALELLTTLSTAVVAVEIGLRLLASQLNFENAFFILLIAPEFYLPLRTLGLRFHAGMQGQTAAIELMEMLDQTRPISATTFNAAPSPASDAPIHLSLQNIFFHYPGDEREVLQEINIDCQPGTLTAIIGRSGSGKSTLAKLVLRFIQPDEGQIHLNGINAEEIPLKEWYRHFAWIGQQSFYAEGSLRDNLLFANSAASRTEVKKVLSRVGLQEKIESLPDGLDTPMEEFGHNFSGGELQRLQLARTLLSPAPFLVMDEPTSQLDPDLEQLFIRELQTIKTHKTILLIAHRLQTVTLAEQILVLEQGHIVERGNHTALLQQQGSYARMIATYQRQGA
jgi:ATP-binding cassette, subfamily C, bacterial CydD